jgi:hypothetical protein
MEYPYARLTMRGYQPSYRWGVAYRIVDAKGQDMVAWERSMGAIKESAQQHGITIVGKK